MAGRSLTALAVFLNPGNALAHGGGEKKEKPAIKEKQAPAEPAIEIEMEEESSLEDSIYGGDGEESGAEESAEMEGSSFLPDLDLLTEDLSGMDMGKSGGHSQHAEEEIVLGAHEMVSPKSKGYGAAVGITVLAGLAFGFLTLKRPFK